MDTLRSPGTAVSSRPAPTLLKGSRGVWAPKRLHATRHGLLRTVSAFVRKEVSLSERRERRSHPTLTDDPETPLTGWDSSNMGSDLRVRISIFSRAGISKQTAPFRRVSPVDNRARQLDGL
jgi:hypothetical protein